MDKTFITVKDLADKLGVSDKTVYRMINGHRIPFAIKIGGQWRFNINEIEKWIDTQEQELIVKTDYHLTVFEAISSGSIFYRLHGDNCDEILTELLNILPSVEPLDVIQLKASILYRESIVSSSLNGVAFMQPSFEKPVFYRKTIVIIGFLEEPKDFESIDRINTSVIFLVLPANKIEQAIIDIKLRRLFMDESFVNTIKSEPCRKELLELIKSYENILLKG